MRLAIGLGGNALLRRKEAPSRENQERNVAIAADALAPLSDTHTLVVTHGNGPHIGILALLEAGQDPTMAQPLDVLGAETDGWIGHLLAQEFRTRRPAVELAVLLTQVRVDPADPAFGRATKPIGAVYEEEEARRLSEARGWTVVPDGEGWRRAVPSPAPLEVLDLAILRRLHEAGALVICAGGGGIPVARDREGRFRGVDAVVDKDATTALLAGGLGVDLLLLLTDVSAVYRDFGTPDEAPIRRIGAGELLDLADGLPEGSIAPKARAAARFVAATGGEAVIGSLAEAADLVSGAAGTRVIPD
ncbi:MAG: carbamate kinase [Longimicrobiales bacterium]|nr:carbamate kinase [Longimicrobiales bacterium]